MAGNVRELENTVARLLALTATTPSRWRSGARTSRRLAVEPARLVRGGDPGPSQPLRARVEAFERSIINTEFESTKRTRARPRAASACRGRDDRKLHKYGLLDRS